MKNSVRKARREPVADAESRSATALPSRPIAIA